MSDTPPPPPRNRAATEARILAAATAVLAEQGFRGFGVNAVARAAKVDKQLIYRYFGDLDGLLDRLGADLGLWIGQTETALSGGEAASYGGAALRLLRAYLAALRANAPARALLAWELVEPTPAMLRLGAARSRAVAMWFASQRPRIGPPPPGVDAPALNALLLAGLHHLVLRESAAGEFAGLDLRDPSSWARLDAALAQITALLDPDSAAAPPPVA